MPRIAFVSSYVPRRCGIATFTADLAQGFPEREIVALRGPGDTIRYEPPVHHVIRADVPDDHARVARSLGDCGIELVSVQHEYGIWGADDGAGILDFLDALSIPAVATLHTVLRHPTEAQWRIIRGILGSTAAVVVMSQAAAAILTARYAADPATVEIIPHGVPDLPLVDPDSIKPSVGLGGRQVVLSFGLIGPSKGYETVIEAMPALVRAVPDACYVVLGATHPELLRIEGESYRSRLESLALELGVADHVVFVDRFLTRPELHRWLGATDVFVTPYPNLDQVVSGTLSYAIAAGKPTVSTPYLYATEILADGRGRLVPAGTPSAMTDALVELLQDQGLRAAMAKRAYAHGRRMTWPRVSAEYARLFARVRRASHDVSGVTVSAAAPALRAVPELPVPGA